MTIDILATIDNAYREGIDTWELMVSAATDDEQSMAILRWRQGDIALRIEHRYGDNAIEKFAQDIGTSYSTVRQRKSMSNFYTFDTRETHPNLFYSHYRAAMKLDNIDLALKALDKASLRGWTYGRFEYFVKRCLGKHAKTTAASITGILIAINAESLEIVPENAQILAGLRTGSRVIVRIEK